MVKDRRTTDDWVTFIKHLIDEHNLSAHEPESFYEYFEPAEACRLFGKLEFHFTPVHGSWLNMAEIEFNRLQQQCLDCRIPDTATLRQEITAWSNSLNGEETDIDWWFTPEDARIKLRRLYPTIED